MQPIIVTSFAPRIVVIHHPTLVGIICCNLSLQDLSPLVPLLFQPPPPPRPFIVPTTAGPRLLQPIVAPSIAPLLQPIVAASVAPRLFQHIAVIHRPTLWRYNPPPLVCCSLRRSSSVATCVVIHCPTLWWYICCPSTVASYRCSLHCPSSFATYRCTLCCPSYGCNPPSHLRRYNPPPLACCGLSLRVVIHCSHNLPPLVVIHCPTLHWHNPTFHLMSA